ncbi:unnamed protein product [Schistosoma margrebowiei]|uniref:Uncharacterized protein n=1 Tax=Schistosoma margrebowiei TaxID=48269 RepID=A0A183LKC1_9TREM|nr:unnamed protein product [Schistosoma margrebowiei]
MVLCFGHKDDNTPHTQGLALMMFNEARHTLIGWESHESRIIKAFFKTKNVGITINLIQYHTLTNDGNDDILQLIAGTFPAKDLTILIGHLDATARMYNTGYRDIMGRYELGERNESAFNNRFQALHDLLKEEITMGGNWIGIKEAIISTCQEVLGLDKCHQKEWISIETLDMIQERKYKKTTINNIRTIAEEVKAQAEYIEENKQVKKADKQKYMKELATTAEKTSREGNMKQLYDTTKKTSRVT